MNIATTVMDEIDIEAEDGAAAVHPMFSDAPRSVSFNKLRKRLLRQVRQALEDFQMLKGQKRWLV
jgi:tRNA 2-thiocytidine biosynthesis protein TtcA